MDCKLDYSNMKNKKGLLEIGSKDHIKLFYKR